MKYVLTLLVMTLFLIVGCSTQDPLVGYCGDNESPMVICKPIEVIDLDDKEVKETTDDKEVKETTDDKEVKETTDDKEVTEEKLELPSYREDVQHSIVRIYDEGDIVSFADIEAIDPDGREVKIIFGHPLNEEGKWQTQEGDAGQYSIEIIASDGIDETKAYVLVIINVKNTPPEIIVNDTFTVLEGETVEINVRVIDPDDDDIKITFSGWMESPLYQTQFGDAGEHTVTITASDGIDQVSKDVRVIVIQVNRPPVIEKPNYDIVALEGELIELDLNIYDPDGDDVIVSYGEPFDNDGKWQTEKGDAGTYNVIVSATDGDETTSISIEVIVEILNEPPVLTVPSVIEVDEGETIIIEYEVYDPDGDEVTVTFSGWMTSNTYTTNYDDSGEYIVTVTASDGIESVSKDVKIIVNDVNRPPIFIWD